MNIPKIAHRYLLCALLFAGAIAAVSCDKSLFDYEDDCEVTHRIKFVYDLNLKWADAFPSEVKSVKLYVFDSKGLFVKVYEDSGEALDDPGYSMELDLPADSYRFVAWCGLPDAGETSFTIPQPQVGVTTIEELTCTLNTEWVDDATTSKKQLHFLYHGYLEAMLEDNHDGTKYEHVIKLTKDTNHIRIILQELSSEEDMQPDKFSFYIESANSRMAYDNRLLASDVVTYKTWSKVSDEVGVGKIDVENGSVKFVKGVIADFSMARLMASQRDDVRLTIVNEDTSEEIVARVPLIQYALLSREYYEHAYGHRMDDQEMLDREDEYVITFFLRDGTWDKTHIDIHQWNLALPEE